MSAEKDLRESRRGGGYWKAGLFYPSVTTIVAHNPAFGINYWKQQEVYRYVIANPGASEQEALAAPTRISDKAKLRGTAIHSIVEAIKRGVEPEVGVPALQPFVQAFNDFRTEYSFEFIDSERSVFNDTEQYAGTLDLIIKPQGSELPIVVDVKTGGARGQIYPEAHLQVSAYIGALRDAGEEVSGGAVLLLKENGKFVYEKIEDCYDVFLHLKQVWEWYHREEVARYESADAPIVKPTRGGRK